MRIQRSAPERGAWRGIAVVSACLVLANCSSSGLSSRIDPKYGVSSSPRVVELGDPVPKGGGTYRIGKPYTVAGVTVGIACKWIASFVFFRVSGQEAR